MNQDPANPQPSWRKPAGMFLILALIGGWTAIVASLSPWVGTWPVLVQAIFYLAAGIVWIAPLKPPRPKRRRHDLGDHCP